MIVYIRHSVSPTDFEAYSPWIDNRESVFYDDGDRTWAGFHSDKPGTAHLRMRRFEIPDDPADSTLVAVGMSARLRSPLQNSEAFLEVRAYHGWKTATHLTSTLPAAWQTYSFWLSSPYITYGTDSYWRRSDLDSATISVERVSSESGIDCSYATLDLIWEKQVDPQGVKPLLRPEYIPEKLSLTAHDTYPVLGTIVDGGEPVDLQGRQVVALMETPNGQVVNFPTYQTLTPGEVGFLPYNVSAPGNYRVQFRISDTHGVIATPPRIFSAGSMLAVNRGGGR